jgi:glucokinase
VDGIQQQWPVNSCLLSCKLQVRRCLQRLHCSTCSTCTWVAARAAHVCIVAACLQAFLDESEVRSSAAGVRAAALAVAGAVENNRCPMTNTNWVIDGKQLQQQFKFRVAVLNDFEAVGYGIPALAGSDLVALNDVPVVAEAPKVVMGEC